MSSLICPSRDALFGFLVGKLSDPDSEAVSEHLEGCLPCQTLLATLDDAGDSLVSRIIQPGQDDALLNEPECAHALARAAAVAQAVAPAGGPPEPKADDQPTVPARLGEYDLLEKLGQGGMGAVYKARHTKLDRLVALKLLPPGRMGDARAVARFEREMKAIGRLDHPNIARAHDAREIEGTPVLVMEYVEGTNLSDLARRCSPMPVAEACELARQAAIALEYAHEHGLVHRDVKPSNLMLAVSHQQSAFSYQQSAVTDGENLIAESCRLKASVKLLDLGLALLRSESATGDNMTSSGQAMGTADYIAPEQVTDSHSVDIRADIYALGCTLYRLLAGRPPFSGPEYPSTFEKMMGHARDPVPPIRGLRPDTPEQLAAVLDRMLAKRPADRFSTPGEVAAALEPFVQGSDFGRLLSANASHDREAAGPSFSIDTDVWRSSALECTKPSGTQVAPEPQSLAQRLRRLPSRRIGLLALASGIVLLGVVVLIQKGRGPVTRVEAPNGSDIRIRPDGQYEVNLPETPPLDGPAPPPSPEHALRVLWQVELRESVQNAITRVNLTPDGKHVVVFHNTASPVARVEKIDAQTGHVLWKRRKDLGGGNSATGWVDAQGNLYLTSVPYPVSVHEGRASWRMGDSKIWKYDPELERELWQYKEPGKGFEYVYNVHTDSQGNVFAAGYTGSQVGEGSLCVKLTNAGSRVWECLTSYGESDAYCEAIALDSKGNLFRVGSDNPGHNAFVRGRILGHRAIDGTVFLDVAVPEASSSVSGVHVDEQGNLFVAYTYDIQRDRSASAKEKVVVARLDRDGRFVWRKPLGGEGMFLSKGALLSGGPESFYIVYRKQTGPAYFPGLAEVNATGEIVWAVTLDLPSWVPSGPAAIDIRRRAIYLGLNHVDDYRSSKVVAVALPEPGAKKEKPPQTPPPPANAPASEGK